MWHGRRYILPVRVPPQFGNGLPPEPNSFNKGGALDTIRLLGARETLYLSGTKKTELGEGEVAIQTHLTHKPLKRLNRDLWGPSGTSEDHLGNGFDEVIGFITDPELPECMDRSVSSSDCRRLCLRQTKSIKTNQISKKNRKKLKKGKTGIA